MFEQFDDMGAIRCAVADILIAISSGRCSEEVVKEVRVMLEMAVGRAHKDHSAEVKA